MLKVESYKKGIVFSTAFNILNKSLVFINGLVVAYFFGTHNSTDIFFYLNNSILILGAYFTSLNTTVIIPESMRIREQVGPKESMSFLNFFLYGYLLLILLSVLAIALNPVSFFLEISNFKFNQLADNAALLRLSLPLFAMICIINLFIDILASHKFFTMPMIVGIINGLTSLLFIALFHNLLGIKSVFLGLLLSYGMNILMLIYIMKRFLKWRFSIVSILKTKRIWKNFFFANLGNFTSTAAGYMPMYILSGFGTGIITALTFAQQISSLPTALITYQFSAVAGIKFNELFAQKNFKELNRTFIQTANFLHFLMLPVSFLVFQFSDQVVEILQRLTSFPAETAGYISTFLRYLSLLIPLLVINSLISRLFMASHKIKESFWYQILFNIILIILLYVGVKKYDIIGYPLAMIVTYTANLICCYFIEKKYFKFIDYLPVISQLIKIIIVNLFICIVVFYLIQLFGSNESIINAILGSITYLLLLFAMTYFFKLNELVIAELAGFLKKRKL